MSRATAPADNDGPASRRTAHLRLPLSVADRKQAELFAALLDEHRNQIAEDIRNTATALAHHRDSGDTLTSHRLRQVLKRMSHNQDELDLLCNSLCLRLTAEVRAVTQFPQSFDITVTRRRTGWRMEIPKFNVVLANIESRTETEDIGRSIIAAITGLPTATIVVRSLVG